MRIIPRKMVGHATFRGTHLASTKCFVIHLFADRCANLGNRGEKCASGNRCGIWLEMRRTRGGPAKNILPCLDTITFSSAIAGTYAPPKRLEYTFKWLKSPWIYPRQIFREQLQFEPYSKLTFEPASNSSQKTSTRDRWSYTPYCRRCAQSVPYL